MRTIKKGATSQSIYFDVLDSTSTTGGRKTGLAYNTSSLVAYYVRNGDVATAITLATLAAANTAWSSGGFKEVDATNMPGIYRLDAPDAAFATGAESVAIVIKGATGMVQASCDVQLVDNLASDIYSRLGAPAGASTAADVAAIKAVLPAALVSGRIDASVGAMAANVLTATAIAADAITDAKVASDVTIASVTGAVGSVAGNVGGNVVGSVGSVTGLTASNLDATISSRLAASSYTAPDNTSIAAILVDTAEIGTAGAGLTALGDTRIAHLDADVSSRLASGSYTAPDNAGIAAVQAKTDNLPSDPADQSLIIAATNSILSDTGGIKSVTDSLVMTAGKLWVLDETGNALPHAADVKTQADQALADAGVTTTVTGRIDVATSTRLAAADYVAPDDTAVLAAIGGLNDLSAAEVNAEVDTAISDAALATAASLATTDGKVDAVKAKTDGLNFTGAAVDANIAKVNGVTVAGNGTTGNEWGPA